jgi:hypothetical protein
MSPLLIREMPINPLHCSRYGPRIHIELECYFAATAILRSQDILKTGRQYFGHSAHVYVTIRACRVNNAMRKLFSEVRKSVEASPPGALQ